MQVAQDCHYSFEKSQSHKVQDISTSSHHVLDDTEMLPILQDMHNENKGFYSQGSSCVVSPSPSQPKSQDNSLLAELLEMHQDAVENWENDLSVFLTKSQDESVEPVPPDDSMEEELPALAYSDEGHDILESQRNLEYPAEVGQMEKVRTATSSHTFQDKLGVSSNDDCCTTPFLEYPKPPKRTNHDASPVPLETDLLVRPAVCELNNSVNHSTLLSSSTASLLDLSADSTTPVRHYPTYVSFNTCYRMLIKMGKD